MRAVWLSTNSPSCVCQPVYGQLSARIDLQVFRATFTKFSSALKMR